MKQNRLFTKTIALKMKAAVMNNAEKVFQEIRETKVLYQSMLKWSSGEQLTKEEKVAVKSQLLDICKTIPALAVFLAPFGSILLPVLIKYLPFNILPTAFKESSELKSDQ